MSSVVSHGCFWSGAKKRWSVPTRESINIYGVSKTTSIDIHTPIIVNVFCGCIADENIYSDGSIMHVYNCIVHLLWEH